MEHNSLIGEALEVSDRFTDRKVRSVVFIWDVFATSFSVSLRATPLFRRRWRPTTFCQRPY